MRSYRFLVLIAACLASGCGLEAPFSLSPPGGPTAATPTNPLFEIVKTETNNEGDLLGFELYYKFYGDQQVESNLGGGNFTELDLRVTYGFRPLYVSGGADTADNHQRPLVEIDPADIDLAVAGVADFEDPGNPFIEFSGATIQIGRSTSSGIKRFVATDFDQADADVATVYAVAKAAGLVYIAIYAMSYGRRDISTEIWSSPVYLGYTYFPI